MPFIRRKFPLLDKSITFLEVAFSSNVNIRALNRHSVCHYKFRPATISFNNLVKVICVIVSPKQLADLYRWDTYHI